MSRDGGAKWKHVKQGNWIYETGDHGALIVTARKDDPTTDVQFSLDEGHTWNKFKVSEKRILVQSIVIEPRQASQQFILHGLEWRDSGSEGKTKAFFSFVDFSSLYLATCRGEDSPGSKTSDFELWAPSDHLHQKCFLGQTVSFVRRKPQRMCLHGEDFRRRVIQEPCECSSNDYECDFGFTRSSFESEILDCVPLKLEL